MTVNSTLDPGSWCHNSGW